MIVSTVEDLGVVANAYGTLPNDGLPSSSSTGLILGPKDPVADWKENVPTS